MQVGTLNWLVFSIRIIPWDSVTSFERHIAKIILFVPLSLPVAGPRRREVLAGRIFA